MVKPRLARPPGGRRAGEASAGVRLTLKPGQRGTRRLLARYGDQLVCVRYRYDATRQKRFTTVELVVDERDWTPRSRRPLDGEVVGVRVAFDEIDVRRRIREAGGTWDAPRRVWLLTYGAVVQLGLADRLVARPAYTGRCPAMSPKHLQVDAPRASR